jgi:hypothetical protein
LDPSKTKITVIFVCKLGIAQPSLGSKVEPFFHEQTCHILEIPPILELSLRMEQLTRKACQGRVVYLAASISMENLKTKWSNYLKRMVTTT